MNNKALGKEKRKEAELLHLMNGTNLMIAIK